MKIMSVNSGSSSLKFCLFDMDYKNVVARGLFERIGIDNSKYTIKFNDEVISEEMELMDHSVAVSTLLEKLQNLGLVKSLDEIVGVGHRIVQGKDVFKESVIVTDKVMEQLENLIPLAPLHNKANVMGIKAFQEFLPNAIMVACFDTAYHMSMEEESYLYAIPYKWYSEYGVRKYGAHGISHRYVSREIRKLLGKDEFKLISCHLGSGASITAIENGKSIDTSMGFTPLAGLIMMSRSGDVDPSIIPYVMEKEGKNASEVIDDLNRNSGLLALSEYSGDMRDILAKALEGDSKCILAKNKFVRRVVDYIAQYYVLLGGCDVLAFTAGIGENRDSIRQEICEKLECLGIKIDKELNKTNQQFTKISSEESKTLIYVVPTDEELMIAEDTFNLINR